MPLKMLQTQAQKLLFWAESIDTWNDTSYGRYIRFCDQLTLDRVKRCWSYYSISSLASEFRDQQQSLKKQWQTAKDHERERNGTSGSVLTGLRSTAPFIFDSREHVENSHRTYWATGTTEGKTAASMFNPMFGWVHKTMILHHGTDPLLGYHQSIAYAELTKTSPLESAAKSASTTSPSSFKSALVQFKAWSKSFRSSLARIVLRFSHSDAIAFCSVLQYQSSSPVASVRHCYRMPWSYESMELDRTDYGPKGTAPITFHVIDTSNLIDHLGSLNVLVATSPLLIKSSSSAIRTEMLLLKEADGHTSTKTMLCGNLPDVALLLGLRPVHFHPGVSGSWTTDHLIDDLDKGLHPGRYVIIWRNIDAIKSHFDPQELARFVYNMYLEMFRNENIGRSIERMAQSFAAHDVYTRSSLSAFLLSIRMHDLVQWDDFIKVFVSMVENDRKLLMGNHHIQASSFHSSLQR